MAKFKVSWGTRLTGVKNQNYELWRCSAPGGTNWCTHQCSINQRCAGFNVCVIRVVSTATVAIPTCVTAWMQPTVYTGPVYPRILMAHACTCCACCFPQGSYAALDGGSTLWALEALTGDYVFKFKMEGNAVGAQLPMQCQRPVHAALCMQEPDTSEPAGRQTCAYTSTNCAQSCRVPTAILSKVFHKHWQYLYICSGSGTIWCMVAAPRQMSCWLPPRMSWCLMKCLRRCCSMHGGECTPAGTFQLLEEGVLSSYHMQGGCGEHSNPSFNTHDGP